MWDDKCFFLVVSSVRLSRRWNASLSAAFTPHCTRHPPGLTAHNCVLQFKEITKAYEILSDENKRRMYDEGGEEAVEGGGGGGHDAHDIFSAFFGGGGRRGPSGPKKGEDLVHPIALTLENL